MTCVCHVVLSFLHQAVDEESANEVVRASVLFIGNILCIIVVVSEQHGKQINNMFSLPPIKGSTKD